MHPRARELIDALRLSPHPEGGFYREIYRSGSIVRPAGSAQPKSATTSIYFLLTEGAHSRWHRVGSDEIWHLYEGGPLELMLTDPDVRRAQSVILRAADRDCGPVHAVAAHHWQAAMSRGAFALAGCTVAPGFEFSDFAFLREHPQAADRLAQLNAQWAQWL